MKNPIISIVVPIYNVGNYLEQCLNSLVHQTMKEIEVICVNDGSTDNSAEILDNFAQQFAQIVVVNKKNGGYGAAVNRGIELSKGEYVGIVEPDDFVVEDMFESLYNAAVENGKPDMVKAAYWEYIDGEIPKLTEKRWIKRNDKKVFTLKECYELLHAHPSVWSCIYNKEFLQNNSIRMIEAKGAGWVDNPFFYETVCQAKSIYWLDKLVYYYRQHENSSSVIKDCSIPLERINDIFAFLKRKEISDESIYNETYQRALLYITYIENSPYLTDENLKEIKKIVASMDRKIVEKTTPRHIECYNRYCNPKERILPSYKERVKTKLRDGKFTKLLYRLIKKLYYFQRHVFRYGLKSGIRCIVRSINNVPKLPSKEGKRVLFIPSDNNRSSGAFLSMVMLNVLLRDKYNLDTFVVLPNPGKGEELLIQNNIPYTMIESKDWVIPLSQEINEKYVTEIEAKKEFNKKAINNLEKFIKRNNFDLVHINTTYSYVGAVAAKKAGIPFVWHIREFLEEDQGNTLWDRKKGNELISESAKVIAISDSIYDKYKKIIDPSKLVCIHNGIDHKKFYMPQKNILDTPCVKMIFVGGFEYYKGQLEFAKACAGLDLNKYDFEIHFIGTGKMEVRNQVEKILVDSNLGERTFFHGYQENVNDYLRESDISFTCAKSEAWGRTTVEAMLAGNLVVGANTAGTKDLIDDRNTGILYEQGNIVDLREKIQWAMDCRTEAKIIAKKGQDYMYQNMTAEKNADRIFELYNEVIG